jgi:hypothetical protein
MAVSAAGEGHAAVVNWSVSGAFDDGGTFAGTFEVDPATDKVEHWAVSSTDGSTEPGHAYKPCRFSLVCPLETDSATIDTSADLNFDFSLLNSDAELQFTSLPLTAGGAVAGMTGGEAYSSCVGYCVSGSRTIVSGSAFGAVPEPTSWATMLLGLGGLGGVMRRRRALAAA